MVRIKAEASGAIQPYFAPSQSPWSNGDFTVAGDDPIHDAGDEPNEYRYHNEVTSWTFDFTQDPGWAAFWTRPVLLSSALLLLTLRPSFGGLTTNYVQIAGMRYFGHPQDPINNPLNYIQTDAFYNLAYQDPASPPLVVALQLMPQSRYQGQPADGYSGPDILRAVAGRGGADRPKGKLHMVYADDSLVTHAELYLARH